MQVPLVRVAAVADAPAIAEIHVLGWRRAYAGIVPAAQLDALDIEARARFWTDVLTQGRPGRRTWVAERDHVVAGFATAGPTRDDDRDPIRVGELMAIYVAPSHWRSGAGAALLAEVEAFLRAEGFIEATLWVLRENLIGRGFYDKHGWEPDGVEKTEVWDGASLDEVRYRRRL